MNYLKMNFNRIKIILCILLCLTMILSFVSCNKENEDEIKDNTTSSSNQQSNAENDTESKVIYDVSGNEYKVDISTINVAWDDKNEPTQIQKDYFISLLKTKFGSSKITFLSENAFTMSGTNNENEDFIAEDCERIDNELFKEIDGMGNVDVLIYEDRVSFLCDFFAKGWGMYFSIDYALREGNEPT